MVSNNVNSVTSSIVNLVLLPPLPPGGIFYDAFDYPPVSLRNNGDYTPLNSLGCIPTVCPTPMPMALPWK